MPRGARGGRDAAVQGHLHRAQSECSAACSASPILSQPCRADMIRYDPLPVHCRLPPFTMRCTALSASTYCGSTSTPGFSAHSTATSGGGCARLMWPPSDERVTTQTRVSPTTSRPAERSFCFRMRATPTPPAQISTSAVHGRAGVTIFR